MASSAEYSGLPRTASVLSPTEAERLRLLSPDSAPNKHHVFTTDTHPPLSASSPRTAIACLRLLIVTAIVVVVVVVLCAALLPLRLLIEKYISEVFHIVPHAPAVVNLQAGTIELHFSSSFKVTNGMSMSLNGVALEIDYIYAKDSLVYSLARAMSPELLQMEPNKSLAVLLDRDFYLQSVAEPPATSKGKKTLADAPHKPSPSEKDAVDSSAQNNINGRNEKLKRRSILDEFMDSLDSNSDSAAKDYDRLREIAEDVKWGDTPDLYDEEDQAYAAHKRNGDLDGVERVTYGGRSRQQQKFNQQQQTHHHEPHPRRQWQSVPDKEIESFILAAHTECLKNGKLNFVLGVKFYYHFFLNIWTIFRTAMFEYEMKCIVINTKYPVFGDYSPAQGGLRDEI